MIRRTLPWSVIVSVPLIVGATLMAFSAMTGCAALSPLPAPPARYVHSALPPGEHDVVIPSPEISRYCTPDPGHFILGCHDSATHTVYRPTCWSDPVGCWAVKREEYAHAWGWPANHPR